MRLTPYYGEQSVYSMPTNLSIDIIQIHVMETTRTVGSNICAHDGLATWHIKIINTNGNTALVAIQNTYSTFIRECQVERECVSNAYLNDKLHFYIQTFFVCGCKHLITSLWFNYSCAKILHIELYSILCYF